MAIRRRNFLTKKDFQTRFALPFLLASLLANVITVTIFIVLARGKMDSLLFSMRLPSTSVSAFFAPAALTAITAAIVALSLLFLWAARGMYHKIAGPLLQIRADLHKMRDDDLSARVTLRDADEFKDFAGEINAMVEALDSRISVLKAHAEDLARTAGAAKASRKDEEFQAAMQKMRGLSKSMEEQIRSFTL
jgi:methyl-accepting chemotaxis protein